MSDNREKEPVLLACANCGQPRGTDSPCHGCGDPTNRNEQPPPVQNDRVPVWDAVIARMHDRDRIGQERYKTRLQAGNGRDSLRDALEEAMDQCAYLEQAAQDRDDDKREIERLRAALEDVSSLLAEMKRYVVHHGILIGECVAWNRLKEAFDTDVKFAKRFNKDATEKTIGVLKPAPYPLDE